MIPLPTYLFRLRRTAVVLPAALGLALFGTVSGYAKPVPSNLGNGLDKLVANNLALAAAGSTSTKLGAAAGTALNTGDSVTVNGKTYVDAATAAVATSAIQDAQGRVLVRVTLNGAATFKQTSKAMKAAASSLSITAKDKTYRGVGVMNAYVDVADVPALASAQGVSAVILEWKPRHNKTLLTSALTVANPDAAFPTVGETLNKLGTTFDQGVTQHGIDQINKFYNPAATLDLEGQGMQIGAISNSYNSATSNPASTDVANGDLPGTGNPVGNTTPVFVLQDDTATAGDDEGRGMLQIVHKMAPKATIAFATADSGEVGFANNIRGLAGINSSTYPNASTQGFAADTICDDVGYYDEPFFQDGIIASGITDAAAAGVSYFSSAANDIGTNGYDSDTRWVANGTGLTAAAGNTALAGTNINLANVPANLYAGGFHNFNPNGLDVAQTVNITSTANEPPTEFQWNDPYDQNTQATGATTVFTGSGNYTTAPVYFTITTPVTAGTKYQIVEAATNNSGFDAIVSVYKSDGTTLIAGPQDTGTDETIRFSAPANDTGFVYEVNHYGSTTGTFSVNASSFTGFSTPSISTSLSLLVFNASTGAYIATSSLTTDATTTNEPLQLGYTYRPTGATQVQYVIARSTVPAAGFNYPTHLRYLIPGNGLSGIGPAEYFTYNTVTTGGHAMSPSCNGCAAYSVFRPSLPETFTSPGPVTVYYDTSDNRLATPDVRLQPRVAFADGANVSANLSAVFASDNADDPDTTQGQFYGTSATGPHAAAIAALVLQNKGGRHSVTPAQMTSLLERSTLPHDLDPNFSSGNARVTGGTTGTGKIAITISSDGSAGSATNGQGLGDTTSFTVSYVGGSSVTSLVFNPGGTAATAGNVSGGNNGVVYNAADATVGGTVTYFENSLPGTVFLPATKAFTLNTTLADSVAGAVSLGSNANGANATQYFTNTITIPSGNFPSTKKLRFTIGRGLAFAPTATAGTTTGTVVSATAGAAYYSADIFGGGVTLPEGTVNTKGMSFSGTTADGGTFSGTIVNNIGSGWSKTDGYGFVNAVTAVGQSVQ